jgi:hypothetical protein
MVGTMDDVGRRSSGVTDLKTAVLGRFCASPRGYAAVWWRDLVKPPSSAMEP